MFAHAVWPKSDKNCGKGDKKTKGSELLDNQYPN